MLKKDRYQLLRAKHSTDFNTCFYCGCIATEFDYAPPLKFVDYYITTQVSACFYKVPACRECFNALKTKRAGTLEERKRIANKALAKTYQRAITVYNMWDEDELDELDYELHRSVSAGLKLGEEAVCRIEYQGFDYEVDGESVAISHSKKQFHVFDVVFSSFKEALDYGAKTYRIPKAKLNELFCQCQYDFSKAITHFQDQQTALLHARRMKRLCADFAAAHKQNVDFVIRTVELFMSKDDTLTLEQALEQLLTQYIQS